MRLVGAAAEWRRETYDRPSFVYLAGVTRVFFFIINPEECTRSLFSHVTLKRLRRGLPKRQGKDREVGVSGHVVIICASSFNIFFLFLRGSVKPVKGGRKRRRDREGGGGVVNVSC